jgi:hypothetical protein
MTSRCRLEILHRTFLTLSFEHHGYNGMAVVVRASLWVKPGLGHEFLGSLAKGVGMKRAVVAIITDTVEQRVRFGPS